MKECVLYARISDAYRQGDGYSIEAQISQGSIYAERMELEVSRVFIEKESAKDSGRPVFSEVMAYVKKQKKPVVLLVEKTDRLYRNSLDKYLIECLVKERDLEVHLFKEGEVLKKGLSSHKKAIHGFKALMAECYIDNLREEALKGTKQKLLNGGWPSQAPYGYKNEKKEVVVNEAQAPLVREVFHLYSSGLYSLERLAERLEETGFVYRSTTPRINRAALAQMLKNPFYIGEMLYLGEVYPGKHAPLIDKSIWLQAQEALRKDGKPLNYKKNEFRFQGLMTCGKCGGSVVGESKKGGKYTYYRCAANTRGCEQGYVNEIKLETQFAEVIRAVDVPETVRREILEAVQELDSFAASTLSDEMRKVQDQLQAAHKRRRKIYQDHLEEIIDDEFFQQVNADIQTEIRMLQTRFEKLSESDVSYLQLSKNLLELPKTLPRKWIASNDRQKRKILKNLCSNFILDSETISYELNEPYSLLTQKGQKEKWWAEPDKARTLLTLQASNIRAVTVALSA